MVCLKRRSQMFAFYMMWFIFFVQSTLYIENVLGDDPLQALLSTLECFKFDQEGCDEDFTDAYPELSRSFDNTSRAATRFYLFTPKNVDDPELIHKCAGRPPPRTNFNPECKTMFVFPGFFSGICHFAIYKELVYERMKCGCYNYIHIEWTWGNSFDGITAVLNMKIVAKQTAVVIRNLKEMYNLQPKDFFCMGHSLGAHGCGFVGQDEKIGAIDAIDTPAILFSENMPLDERLDPGDAPCVQATYSSYGYCFPISVGGNFTFGTKNFFFNDALNQPSCIPQTFISFLKGDYIYALLSLFRVFCSHLQSLQYYKTSMCSRDCRWLGVECKDYDTFKSGQCDDCGSNGEKCDFTGNDSCDCGNGNSKNYFLKTSLLCPYCDDGGIKNLDKYQCRKPPDVQ